jgi:phytoene dehydrogenase-like protein
MRRWDVIVIGAGLAGMLAGAMLARRGRRVLILEREARPGGRLRSYDADGFVVDCGAFLWPNAHLDDAFAAAGVSDFVASDISPRQLMRIYVDGLDGKRFAFPWLGRDASGLDDTIREVYRIRPADFRGLTDLLARLSQIDEAELAALQHVTVANWLARHVTDATVAEALVRTLMLFGTWDPRQASIGDFARSLRRNRPGAPTPKAQSCGHNATPGVRALVDAVRAAVERSGAELRLSTTVDEIVVHDGRVSGVVAHGPQPYQESYVADVVVSNLPIWTLFDIISDRHFAADFAANARHYAKVGGTVGVAYAFKDLPRLRETGEPDRFPGWTRLLVGAERDFGGGLFWPSHHSPRNALAGMHLLQGMRLASQSILADAEQVDRIVANFDRLVRQIYAGVDDLLLWRRRWITRDGTEYLISAVPRPEVRAPVIGGLYFVGETINLPSVQMDAAAHSALECARLITSD